MINVFLGAVHFVADLKETNMSKPTYYAPHGGLPAQHEQVGMEAIFTNSYMLMPKGVMSDIVTSNLPFWDKTRVWVLARPLSGFSETFSHYIMEVQSGGGSDKPEPDSGAEGVLFVVEGVLTLCLDGQAHKMSAGGYAFIPSASDWQVSNDSGAPVRFHWIRKAYDFVEGIAPPKAFVTSDQDVAPNEMPDTNGTWSTTRFVNPNDVAHDMHVNIVTFKTGGRIPFPETHVMEHGLYVLQGKGVYYLNQDEFKVEPGDYMWLRAFCPQWCYTDGPEDFRYLLYKDVNRQVKLRV